MPAIQRVLCPFDSSDFSARALRFGAALASWYGAELTALSVQPRVVPSDRWLSLVDPVLLEPAEQEQAGEQALLAFVSRAVGEVPAKVVVRPGLVVDEILRMAAETSADLIVMGTHGTSGFERVLLGSVTEKVLRKAPCPVLVVPRAASPETTADVVLETIVCGVDLSDASKGALEYARSLATQAGAHLVVVHAVEWVPEDLPSLSTHFDVPEYRRMVERDTRAALEAFVPADGTAEIVLTHGKASRELTRIAGERHADAIVLGVQGRGALDRAIFGSTAAHVVRTSTVPVLTVPVPPQGGA